MSTELPQSTVGGAGEQQQTLLEVGAKTESSPSLPDSANEGLVPETIELSGSVARNGVDAGTSKAGTSTGTIRSVVIGGGTSEGAGPSESTTTNTMGQHKSSPVLSVRSIPGKGRGVFAAQAIPRGTVIERSPCIAFPPEQYRAHAKVSVTRLQCERELFFLFLLVLHFFQTVCINVALWPIGWAVGRRGCWYCGRSVFLYLIQVPMCVVSRGTAHRTGALPVPRLRRND